MDDLPNLVPALCSSVAKTRLFLQINFAFIQKQPHVILILIHFCFPMVHKCMKMKTIIGSLRNLFILRKSLGMSSSQIIHRDASRVNCGNSFFQNNFSIPTYL